MPEKTHSHWRDCQNMMSKTRGIQFADGLSETDFQAAESKFGFTFPDDLREFLAIGMPVSEKFPDWRNVDDEKLAWRMQWPLEGLLFDVEHARFWMTEWGARPDNLQDAFAIATEKVAAAPTLIPIYSHRMLACEPSSAGNPVFSVHQTDIIFYGIDLRDYLIHEFAVPESFRWPVPQSTRKIAFWDDIIYDRGIARSKNG